MYKKNFQPDYKNILSAVNKVKPVRLPFYEHIVDDYIIEKVLGIKFAESKNGSIKDREYYYSNYINFFIFMGYDVLPFSKAVTSILPGGGALYLNKKDTAIKNSNDFNSYPWSDLPMLFFKKYETDYEIMSRLLPKGMMAVGGPGNGVFECVQDLVGLENLSLISVDNPRLYKLIFKKMGDILFDIWKLFLKKFSKAYVFLRFGDDLGFKTSTILNPEDIKSIIIPEYKRIISLVHSYNKPFLLHSCGNIFSIMDCLINEAKIDAKHSNEDIIAPFKEWQEKYGDRIALFGGVDMSFVCNKSEDDVKGYVNNLLKEATKFPGFAFGTGNSVPDYIPVENYIGMIETARKFRREKL